MEHQVLQSQMICIVIVELNLIIKDKHSLNIRVSQQHIFFFENKKAKPIPVVKTCQNQILFGSFKKNPNTAGMGWAFLFSKKRVLLGHLMNIWPYTYFHLGAICYGDDITRNLLW